MFKKLKLKFIILNMSIITIVMLCAFTAIYSITYINIQNQNTLKLSNISSNALRFMDGSTDTSNLVIVDSFEHIQSFSILIDKDDTPLFDNSYGAATNELFEAAVKLALLQSDDSMEFELNHQLYQFSISPVLAEINMTDIPNSTEIKEKSLRQITFLNITDSKNILSQLLITFILVAIFTLSIIFAISIYFAKNAVKPIEQSYIKQKQFIQDASHELKTPIASINSNLDVLVLNKQDNIESQIKWIEYITYETARMNKLVNDLLCLAKTDTIGIYSKYEEFNLSEIIGNSLLSMEAIAYEKGLKLIEDIEANVIIKSDKEKVEQIFKILLDNAFKYVDDYGNIKVSLDQKKNHIILSVSNTGSYIPKEHIEKIFDRFYRVDASRKHNGSYGLGLSIAKAIIENLGGSIFVKSNPNENTTFTIKLNKNIQ